MLEDSGTDRPGRLPDNPEQAGPNNVIRSIRCRLPIPAVFRIPPGDGKSGPIVLLLSGHGNRS